MPEYKYQLNIRGPEGFEIVFPVAPGISRFGRQPGNAVVLPHTQVSRGHAQLETTSQGCLLTDLGSSNGTSLNGEKIAPQVPVALKDGDRIKIGPFDISVQQTVVELTAAPEVEAPVIDPSLVSAVEPAPAAPADPAATAGRTKPPELKKTPAVKKKAAPAETLSATGAASRRGTLIEKPPEPPRPPDAAERTNGYPKPPPGLSLHSRRLLEFLPGIYHTDFMSRFLGIFEATQLPIEWTIDHFDLFLDPLTAPVDFLSWLSSWFGVSFDSTWTEEKRRLLLREAHQIYARRGTRWALSRVLEIYTGVAPEIDDLNAKLDPFTFSVTIPLHKRNFQENLVEALIEAHKPAHTNYSLVFKP